MPFILLENGDRLILEDDNGFLWTENDTTAGVKLYSVGDHKPQYSTDGRLRGEE